MIFKKVFPALVCLTSCLLVFTPHSLAQDTARIEEIILSFVPDRFMGSVLINRGDESVFNEAYGSANLEWAIPNTTDTKFRLGSITKQFTAAAILILEEQGKLSTDDLVSDHIENLPGSWSSITLFNLLTHTSGIFNYTALPGFLATATVPTTPEELIDRLRDLPLDFETGSEFRYSNSGYLVLGLVIETITDQSYADFVSENIFMPLGMADSGYDSFQEIIKNRASGYTPGPEGPVNAAYVDMSIPHAAGALYSTTADLARWNQGLYGGELLSADSLEKMLTPHLGDYAFGLFVTNEDDHQKATHGGAIQGFNSSMVYYPDEELTIVALSNINGPVDLIVNSLDRLLHGEEVVLPNERVEISLREEQLPKYVGSYPLAPNLTFTVTIENGQLMAQSTGPRKVPLYAESESRFFLKVADVQIEFEFDETGDVTGLTLHQGSLDFQGPREEVVEPVERVEITLAESLLEKYVGSYALAPNFILTVTLEDGQLMSQATGQQKLPLYAESENSFFLKVVDAQIDFETDDAGTVTGLVLHQAGRDMPAPKQE